MVSEFIDDWSPGTASTHPVNGSRLLEWLTRAGGLIAQWHRDKPEFWEWTAHRPDKHPLDLIYLIDKLTYHNYIIWHQEENCRTKEPAAILASKPTIDKHNQARNNVIEQIDDAAVAHIQIESNAPFNCETLGSLVDRYIITRLKFYHTLELDPTGIQHLDRLNLLLEQLEFLGVQAATLMNQVSNGERRIKTFRQLKMYNCSLNPKWNKNYFND